MKQKSFDHLFLDFMILFHNIIPRNQDRLETILFGNTISWQADKPYL